MTRMTADRRQELLSKVMKQLEQGASLDMVTCPIEQLWQLRDERLRKLIAHAKSKSKWHRKRLKDVHPKEVNASNLHELPVMTRTDLMENWDAICTVRGLTLTKAKTVLADLAARRTELDFSHPLIMSTAGSSGSPAIVAWDLDAWSQMAAAAARYRYWLVRQAATTPPGSEMIHHLMHQATLTSTSDVSMPRQMAAFFASDDIVSHAVRANQPMFELLEELSKVRHLTGIFGYASAITAAAIAASKRGTRLKPSMIGASGEPFTPAMAAFVKEIFGADPSDTYSVTEISAAAARSYPGYPDLILAEDIAIYEPVRMTKTGKRRPAKSHEFSDTFVVTNVLNHAIPLIRYEMADQVRIGEKNPEIPWTGRRLEIGAVVPNPFLYSDGRSVNPVGIGYVLDTVHRLVDYSVRQTQTGIEISYWSFDDIDAIELFALEERIREASPELADVPMQFNPVSSVDVLPRTPAGKRRRYVQLAGG